MLVIFFSLTPKEKYLSLFILLNIFQPLRWILSSSAHFMILILVLLLVLFPGIMTNLGRSELKFTQDRGKIMEENGVRKISPIHPGRKNILWSSLRSSSKSFKLYNYLLLLHDIYFFECNAMSRSYHVNSSFMSYK